MTSRFALRSPIRGWILERHATIGANVDSKDQLFLVADLTEVWVQAAVYERDLPSVRTGMAAVVTVQALPGSRWRGEVTYLGQIVDDRTRTVPIRIVVKNEPVAGSGDRFPLRPGSFVTVELEVARKTGVLVVPLAAVQTDQGEPLVFVQAPRTRRERRADAPFEFERRAVRLGARDAEFVEVLSGVKEGDLVVVENAFLLKSEFEKSAMGDQD